MKYLIVMFLIVHLVTVFRTNCVNSYVLHRNQDFMPMTWDHVTDDYLMYDSDEEHGTEILGCEGKDCLKPTDVQDNEVNRLVDVDCSTGYDRNELPNELPVIRHSSENENSIHNHSDKELSSTTENGLYISSSEISDLIDSLSNILKLDENLEHDSSINIIADDNYLDLGDHLDNWELPEFSEAEEPTVLLVGFEGSDNSVNSKEETVLVNNEEVLLADLLGEDSIPDTSVEWLDDSGESEKVVENGYIYYDMESRE